ncbi:MAG: hypothetical protein K6C10_00270 [Prevotella sp.]|nr:hypothetical protein [Prevotella sp.]
MKRKFLSTLLMGAMFIASVSVLTSCKDYDDDITGLQSQVDALKTELNTKVSALEAAQAACKSECQTAQANLDAAIKALEAKAATKDELNAAVAAALTSAKETAEGLDAEVLAAAKAYADAAAEKAAATAKAEAIAEAKAYADGLYADLDAKKVDVATYAAKMQELDATIAALTGRVEAVEGDVEELKNAVSANAQAIAEMKLQIAALQAFDEQVKKDFADVNTEIANVKKALEEQKNALEDQKKSLEAAIAQAKADLQKEIDNLKNSETITGLTSRIEALETKALGIAENAAAIEEIKGAMEEADAKIAELGEAAAKVDVLSLYLTKVLTSIYLKPEFYYSGIEAVELPALYDQAYTEGGEDLTLTETWAKDATVASIDVCKGGVAYYHLNPWNADIDGATVAFISNEAKTRAGANYGVNDLIKPVKENVTNDDKDKNFAGVLAVPFTGSFETINSMLKAGTLPMIALNYKQTVDEKDVNVSSDWALLAPTQYNDLVIADITWSNHEAIIETPECGHLTQDLVGLAVDSIPATHGVKYDETINLSELVRTHYSYSYRNGAGVEVKSEDKLMDQATFDNFGLRYEFALVNYVLGNNNTSESVHVVLEQNENGETIARPVKVTEDGQATTDQADKASVGRMPIVRVLIKTADNQVAAYAYMKLIITEETPDEPPVPEETVDFTADEPFFVDCDDAEYEYTMSWSQVENRILSGALDGLYSKATFEANWTLVGTGDVVANVEDGAEADQFSAANDASKRSDNEKVGKVTLCQDNESGAHTQVLKWTIDHATIENLVAEGKVDPKTGLNTNDFDVYVKFEGKKNVWVHFHIPAGTFHFATGTINDNKTKAYWFALNSKAEGLKETRANVVVPNTQTDDCAFVWDILSAFDNYEVKPTLNNPDKFPAFAEEADYEFTFTTPTTAAPISNAAFNAAADGTWTVPGNSGKTYTVKVAEDAKSIVAVDENGREIATIVVLEGSVLTYQQNDIAFDILNYAGHNEVGSKQTFTAYLKITLAACYEAFIADGSDYFNVKFLRPVDVEKTKNAVVEDAVDGGSKVNVMDLVSLVDWRDQSFTSANGLTDKDGDQADVTYIKYETPHYINYYGVEIAADVDNAMTDINKTAAERAVILEDAAEIAKLVNLKKNSPNCIFTFTPAPITASGNKLVGGEIFYSNNSGNVEQFHIYVPLTISYKWGSNIKCGYGVITVKKTLNQAKKF